MTEKKDRHVKELGLLFIEGESGFSFEISPRNKGIKIEKTELSSSGKLKSIVFCYYDEFLGGWSTKIKVELAVDKKLAKSELPAIINNGIGTIIIGQKL